MGQSLKKVSGQYICGWLFYSYCSLYQHTAPWEVYIAISLTHLQQITFFEWKKIISSFIQNEIKGVIQFIFLRTLVSTIVFIVWPNTPCYPIILNTCQIFQFAISTLLFRHVSFIHVELLKTEKCKCWRALYAIYGK